MKNAENKKIVDKSSLLFWTIRIATLVLALHGIYLPEIQNRSSKNRTQQLLQHLIDVLQQCLIIKSLVEQLLA